MTNWVGEYRATRARISDLVGSLDESLATTRVPACPDWCVRDVMAHLVGMAAALGAGNFPAGDNQAWIDSLVGARRDCTLAELVAEWAACADAIDAFVASLGPGAGQLVLDAVAHEHDIRHAVGRPGARDSSSVIACAEAMSTILRADL
ncbi:MAG TPA: maleylpyruvate isomerase N-terminal domain-containing protein, partial [Acidimicrobiales bacterium]